MSTPSVINNHIQQALDRLLEQYRNKPGIEGIIEALGFQIQAMEDALQDVYDKTDVQTAFGATLDLVGTIVGQDRLGFDDDFYRSLILAKIGENVSQGDIERVIEITKLLTGATLVYLQEYYPAGFGLSMDVDVDPTLINFFYERLDRVDPVAVRLEALICFDANEAFAFEGGPGSALGFGSTTNISLGGLFAKLHIRTKPEFAFEGASPDADAYEGFGTIQDVLVGGLFEGL